MWEACGEQVMMMLEGENIGHQMDCARYHFAHSGGGGSSRIGINIRNVL